MPPQQQQQHPFWEFIQSFDPNRAPGQGVDHHARPPFPPMPGGFPFGGPSARGGPPHAPPQPPAGSWGPEADWHFWFQDGEYGPWGRRGGPHGRHRNRHHHQHQQHSHDDVNMEDEPRAHAAPSDHEREGGKTAYDEKDESPDTLRDDVPDPAEVTPDEDEDEEPVPPPYPHGPWGRRGFRGRGGPHGGCRRGGGRFGRFPQPSSGRAGGPPPPQPFDFPATMRGFMRHPFFRNLRDQAERYFPESSFANNNNNDDENTTSDPDTFQPPLDIFNTERAFILHVALPGAKKEDLGVNWNPETNELSIAGVVHRPGDEDFLQTMTSGERRVGLFDRKVVLPPAGAAEKDDVDGMGITAKMEDGVLVIVVPKAEKEWTEIRKVDIE